MKGKPQFARMPWYPRDFKSSTLAWPLAARAIYRELLDAQWDVGGAGAGVLPDDEAVLRRMVDATPTEWRAAWPLVAPKFPRVPGGRQNPRLEEHRAAAVREFEGRQRGAASTNRKRWGRPRLIAQRSESDSLSDQSAIADRIALERLASTTTSTTTSERRGRGLRGEEVGDPKGPPIALASGSAGVISDGAEGGVGDVSDERIASAGRG